MGTTFLGMRNDGDGENTLEDSRVLGNGEENNPIANPTKISSYKKNCCFNGDGDDRMDFSEHRDGELSGQRSPARIPRETGYPPPAERQPQMFHTELYFPNSL
ncbi:hypothetical protein EDM02_00130 [Candidatus Cardinium hertigii]|uniref:Uncharacterized protein n=1 Tax=Candidatus Cardinium hertigii TaxID=247481 RepID=A0A3N2QDH1_9BACT|nr:hypothetical protein EDM02_00130 [Candidatus Cardinium hertigii]